VISQHVFPQHPETPPAALREGTTGADMMMMMMMMMIIMIIIIMIIIIIIIIITTIITRDAPCWDAMWALVWAWW
jgi:hypothetical protein